MSELQQRAQDLSEYAKGVAAVATVEGKLNLSQIAELIRRAEMVDKCLEGD